MISSRCDRLILGGADKCRPVVGEVSTSGVALRSILGDSSPDGQVLYKSDPFEGLVASRLETEEDERNPIAICQVLGSFRTLFIRSLRAPLSREGPRLWPCSYFTQALSGIDSMRDKRHIPCAIKKVPQFAPNHCVRVIPIWPHLEKWWKRGERERGQALQRRTICDSCKPQSSTCNILVFPVWYSAAAWRGFVTIRVDASHIESLTLHDNWGLYSLAADQA